MTDFYVRWGDDVQPYVMQLASEHIDTLRERCFRVARTLVARRDATRTVVDFIAPGLPQDALDATMFHRFKLFGFHFELREGARKLPGARKQEFILNFFTVPNFAPKDMPARLRRVQGKPLSARPTRRRRPRAAAQPVRAKGKRAGKGKKRKFERIAYRFEQSRLWIRVRAAVLASSFEDKLYKMYDAYQRLSVHAAIMWRRRPRLALPDLRTKFLTNGSTREDRTPLGVRLEPRLLGESLRLLLFTFVSPEPPIDWSAYPFGKLADEGERIAV